MRVLFATGSAAQYMAPPRLGAEQINCGPDWPDHAIGGYQLSLHTPIGEYDLAAVAARLPADQQPDVVVCLVDASWRNLPRRLTAFRCPKVLLVADTHHLRGPITGMIRYAQSEPFDRIVLLYDRHHWEFFRAAGLRQLHWFPGLTFPHPDAPVAAARAATRQPQVAFVGQTGICHPRRIGLLSCFGAHQLPLVTKEVPQTEALGIYGASLVGFNASLNGDLNLRVFEILASGAMLLTDELAPAAGLAALWKTGREIVTYASPAELVERARHALAHPAEAAAIGGAGARWFDENFGEEIRRRAFEHLVADGRTPPQFALPQPGRIAASPRDAAKPDVLTGAFEYVQELHRNLDRVVVALAAGVPEEFAQMCATLPRIEVRRGLPAPGSRVDFLAVDRANFASAAMGVARHIWCWAAVESDRVALVRRCTSMGFSLADAGCFIFGRARVTTHSNAGAVALVRLEQGGYEDALNLAREELERNPRSVDANLVILELAQEKNSPGLKEAALGQLRRLAPHHPRLREILTATPEVIRGRRPTRLLRAASRALGEGKTADALQFAQQALDLEPRSGAGHFGMGQLQLTVGAKELGLAHLAEATRLAPDNWKYWDELGRALRQHNRLSDALGAWAQAATLNPLSFDGQIQLAEAALAAGHGRIAGEALQEADRLRPGLGVIAGWMARARQLVSIADYDRPRDLLLAHAEVTRLQGTGVLLQRFFPQAEDFVTVRSRTLYQGKLEFGGVHFSLDLPGLSDEARRAMLGRLLAPYRIRRILCVPFYASDFVHALAAKELTGAPLCTYAMDDQTVYSPAVPPALAQRVFAASDLRLAISPEMASVYGTRFGGSFGLLPPIVTDRSDEAPNRWESAAGAATKCAMVGNIWSPKQFEQLRHFMRAAGLAVDWFGNAKVAWLPQNRAELERDGIFARGFLPEAELAHRLSAYPFVVIPSGTLDGTEDNEWLTRLSLPSRMVFILAKTHTPMLVLGSANTAAARFVTRFGLGASSNYDAGEAAVKIRLLTTPIERNRLLDNARAIAPRFLLPGCGEWLWRSLAAARPEPTPFDGLFESPAEIEAPAAEPEAPPLMAFAAECSA